MKKRVQTLLAAAAVLGLLTGCGSPAAAPTPTPAVVATPTPTPAAVDLGEPFVQEFNNVGITLELPGLFRQGGRGVAVVSGSGELISNGGIYYLDLLYYALDRDRWQELTEKMLQDVITDQELDELYDSAAILYTVLAVDRDRDFAAINEFAGGRLDPTCAEELAKAEGVTFYKYYGYSAEDTAVPVEYLSEYAALLSALDRSLAQASYRAPDSPRTINRGVSLVWQGLDLAGEPVDTGELFSQNLLTMVNLWTSWCTPCKGEMPALEKLSAVLTGMDCGLVGVQLDSQEALEEGRQVLAQAGVTYRNLQASPELLERVVYRAVPTTLFVNSQGVVVGEAVIGVPGSDPVEGYLDRVRAILADQDLTQEGATPNDQGVYRVYLRDGEGQPVQGAKVQLCSETQCVMADTDAQGLALFPVEEGRYTVKVLTSPQTEEVETLDTYCDLVLRIEGE